MLKLLISVLSQSRPSSRRRHFHVTICQPRAYDTTLRATLIVLETTHTQGAAVGLGLHFVGFHLNVPCPILLSQTNSLANHKTRRYSPIEVNKMLVQTTSVTLYKGKDLLKDHLYELTNCLVYYLLSMPASPRP